MLGSMPLRAWEGDGRMAACRRQRRAHGACSAQRTPTSRPAFPTSQRPCAPPSCTSRCPPRNPRSCSRALPRRAGGGAQRPHPRPPPCCQLPDRSARSSHPAPVENQPAGVGGGHRQAWRVREGAGAGRRGCPAPWARSRDEECKMIAIASGKRSMGTQHRANRRGRGLAPKNIAQYGKRCAVATGVRGASLLRQAQAMQHEDGNGMDESGKRGQGRRSRVRQAARQVSAGASPASHKEISAARRLAEKISKLQCMHQRRETRHGDGPVEAVHALAAPNLALERLHQRLEGAQLQGLLLRHVRPFICPHTHLGDRRSSPATKGAPRAPPPPQESQNRRRGPNVMQ